MSLRLATRADLERLAALAAGSEAAAHWSQSGYDSLFTPSLAPRLCWLSEADDCSQDVDSQEIEGFFVALCLPGEWELENIVVHPGRQRKGVGRRLMEKLFEEARAAGAERILLEVRLSNAPARALYGSLGFAANGRRKGYYSHPEEDALLLARELKKNL